jgi:Zn-finger nucleic acid-binding protein
MPDETPDVCCPSCDGVCEIERHGRLEVDRCTDCGGVWFDRTELGTYATLKGPGVVGWGRRVEDLGEAEIPSRCPRCREETLHPYKWDKLRFSRCSGCEGIHVTREELERFTKDTSEWAAQVEREHKLQIERFGFAADFVAGVLFRLFPRP